MLEGMSFIFLVSFIVVISNAEKLRFVSSSEDDLLLADFYNETTISRIAFGSCR